LATAPDASVRNGAEAVQLAETAKDSAPENAEALDTLAAAYAEDGQFTGAAATAAHALELAQAQGNKKLAAELRMRQVLYEKGEAFHEPKTAAAVNQARVRVQAQRDSQ
jgi:Flp pilus assembly protein TadD